MNPRVSVCIPVFNCEQFVGQAVQSVLEQSCGDFELIVLDNASTDGTLQVIEQFADARVRIVRGLRNEGLEANWNKALREARGDYVKILPADDLLYRDCLERQVAALDDPANRGVTLVCAGRDIIDVQGHRLMTRRFSGGRGRLSGLAAIRRIVRSGTNPLGEPGAILFRAAALERTGPFDGRILYVIDLDLWVRLLLQGDAYVFPEALCAFRLSPASTSVEMATRQSRDFAGYIARLSADPACGLRRIDCALGTLRCRVLGLLRYLVYRFTVKKER